MRGARRRCQNSEGAAAPRLARRLAERALHPRYREAVLRDLTAIYLSRRQQDGRMAALRWYWSQVALTLAARLRGDPDPGARQPASSRGGGSGRLDRLGQDVRFGCRRMVRRPGVSLVAALTVAVGVGASLSVFTIVNGTLLSPPPHVRSPAELVTVYHVFGDTPMLIQYPRFLAYARGNDVLAGMAAYRRLPLHLRVTSEAWRIQGTLVSGAYFDVLGLTAHRGRLLSPADDQAPGGHPVAVISHSLWSRLGQRGVVGGTVRINGHPFDIVGVAPAGFRGIEVGDDTDVWVPAAMQRVAMATDADLLSDERSAWSSTFGRLRPGVSLQAARDRLSQQAAALQEEQQMFAGAEVLLFEDFWVSPYLRGRLFEVNRLLAAVVAVVLVLACANVANLLLAEGLDRRAEVAMRRALGATRRRMLRQLLIEGLLLSGCGSLGGLALAGAATRVFATSRLTANVQLGDTNLSLDHRVLAATLALTFLAGIAFTLLPALHVTSRRRLFRPVPSALGPPGTGARMRATLVVAQVALSFALLVGAGILVRSLLALQAVDPGFRVDNVATFFVDFELEGYDESRGRALAEELRRRLAQIPGVVSASAGNRTPFAPPGVQRNDLGVIGVYLEGGRVPHSVDENEAGPDGRILVEVGVVAARYFETLGVTLVAGRTFAPTDDARSVIVSRQLVEDFWPGESGIGRTLRLGDKDGDPLEIVGVVADHNGGNLARDGRRRQMFRPLAHAYAPDLGFIVHTAVPASELLEPMRDAVADVDDGLVVHGLETMAARVERSLSQPLLLARLTGVFGSIALVLAAVGLYGTLARAVNERVPEFGLRLALGARPADLLRLISRHGLLLVIVGLAVGFPASWALTRLFDSALFGVASLDPTSMVVAAIIMAAVGLVACLAPARRATRVDPAESLRRP